MDTEAIERGGGRPLEPELGAIANLAAKTDLASYLGRLHLAVEGSGLAFGFGANQDFADSTRVIAFAGAGGLSLPDRDYYTKTDEKSVELRTKYRAHVTRMFQLLGDSSGEDVADLGGTLMRIWPGRRRWPARVSRSDR